MQGTLLGLALTLSAPRTIWLSGLEAGLTIDSVVTLSARPFVLKARRLPERGEALFLASLIVVAGLALASHLRALPPPSGPLAASA